MVKLKSFNLPTVFLFTILMSCHAHDNFQGYHYSPPDPHFAPILLHQGYNQRNGFEMKLSLPVVNYFNPNVLESIVNIRTEYQPIPMILTKQHINANRIDKQKKIQQLNKEKNTIATEKIIEIKTKPTEKYFDQDKGKEIKHDNDKIEEFDLESTTEFTQVTTEYDDSSTTEEYTLGNRIAPEVAASLLGG